MLVRERPDFGLDGIYQSIVGRDSGFRTLVGRTSKVDGTKQMVAWVVCFEIADPPKDMATIRFVAGRVGANETT